jgi:hypothetical protein
MTADLVNDWAYFRTGNPRVDLAARIALAADVVEVSQGDGLQGIGLARNVVYFRILYEVGHRRWAYVMPVTHEMIDDVKDIVDQQLKTRSRMALADDLADNPNVRGPVGRLPG